MFFFSTDIQVEAAWILTNVAAGTSEQTMTVIDSNAHLTLLKLIDSPNLEVSEIAVWALSNIAGKTKQQRLDYLSPIFRQWTKVP